MKDFQMAYEKILVDNITCSRRFHITFDNEAEKKTDVKLKCPFCEKIIFEAKDHPSVKIARQENLIQTANLSDRLVRGCDFRDRLSENTLPNSDHKEKFLYK